MMLVEEDELPIAVLAGTVTVFHVGVGSRCQSTSVATDGRVMVLNKKKLARIKE